MSNWETAPVGRAPERNSMECKTAIVGVSMQREYMKAVGVEPLNERHKQMLTENCGSIDFDEWVIDEKAYQARSHKAIDALKAKKP